MARKLIRLTPKQRAEYNRRLSNLASVRQSITLERASGKRSMLDAPVNTKRELPDFVIPREHKKKRFHSQREFLTEFRSLKNYRIDEKEYFRKRYKGKYLDLLGEKIDDVSVQITGEHLEPEGRFGKFTDEQIASNKELSSYMEAFNEMQSMNIDSFKRAYFEGFIIPFRFMYRELTRFGNIGGGQGYSQTLDRQVDLIKEFKEAGRD